MFNKNAESLATKHLNKNPNHKIKFPDYPNFAKLLAIEAHLNIKVTEFTNT